MTERFSHPLLGRTVRGLAGPTLESLCGFRQLTVSHAQLTEVAEKLEPWAHPHFELTVRIRLGNFTTGNQVTAIDKTRQLVRDATRRAGTTSRTQALHGFEWHLCGAVLALKDNDCLRILGTRALDLQPWLEAAAALGVPGNFPLFRTAESSQLDPASGWIEFVDTYSESIARAAFHEKAVHLDLPTEESYRLRQSVVGLHCAQREPSFAPQLPLSMGTQAAAEQWLIQRLEPDAPERLARWVEENGGPFPLANRAAEAERAFGGLRSVDRIQRFGGIQMIDRAIAPGSAADWPLQETPEGPALLMSLRDVDSPDTLACLTEKGEIWAYGFGSDTWKRSSDSVATFITRVARWGHPNERPIHVASVALGKELADTLGLRKVDEASDSTGTFYTGDAALVFERHHEGRFTTRLRELKTEALATWDDLTEKA